MNVQIADNYQTVIGHIKGCPDDDCTSDLEVCVAWALGHQYTGDAEEEREFAREALALECPAADLLFDEHDMFTKPQLLRALEHLKSMADPNDVKALFTEQDVEGAFAIGSRVQGETA